MEKFNVTLFEPFAFETGQKIRITSGKRRGDWEVVGVTEGKVSLRCPISGRQFEWDRFCYVTEERKNEIWPEE
ncbi:MAG: hypothetical protein KJP07_05030 [Desulfatitalea sp.]|nr:hypothetical protein [Desulfatitalea sp.]